MACCKDARKRTKNRLYLSYDLMRVLFLCLILSLKTNIKWTWFLPWKKKWRKKNKQKITNRSCYLRKPRYKSLWKKFFKCSSFSHSNEMFTPNSIQLTFTIDCAHNFSQINMIWYQSGKKKQISVTIRKLSWFLCFT